ncbi:MAG TPA: lysyl oxidase family protein [Gaiellaceae bacterium]|nr:lysyl oxidase family protein [Gaiellaceae bacterium]
MSTLAALAFALAGIHVGADRVLPIGYAPAWSPSGERIAFVTKGNLWVADADGTHRGELVRDADDPAWSPNGRRLAFTRKGHVYTVRVDGLDERALATGAHPAWAPDGNRIVFDRYEQIISVRWYGGAARVVTDGEDPAYAPNGRLAVVQNDEIVVAGRLVAEGTSPAWSPGGQLAYVRGNVIYVGEQAVHKGLQPAWRPSKRVRELLPDFDQRAPTDLTIAGGPGRWLLGFTSLLDNIGIGPSVLVGVRSPGQSQMIGTQRVPLANGKVRTYDGVARFRYTNSPPHHHWHLMRFDSFELHTTDGLLLVRDRKSGFCLADHWGAAPGRWPGRKPHFLGDCDQFHPEATHVLMGTTPGYTDRYPAFFHGQNIDITGVPNGIYVLTHRVNASMQLRELRYDNNAASVRVRFTWKAGYPSVRVLRRCPATATC